MNGPSINTKYDHLSLSARLEHLVGNKFHSDLTFIIEDSNEEVPAHKLIVALASPVLHRIVYGSETFSPADIIKVDGISKESFMQILHHIYTDIINLDDDNVFDILQKSNYFGLSGIESKCLQYLEENLSILTVPWIYHQLFFSAPSMLLNKCVQYIRIQPLEFFASEYFEKITVDELKSVLKLDSINCTEVDLFEAMIKLSRAHCTAAGLKQTAENQRKILHGAETLLRLESLTESEFDKCLAIQKDFYSTTEIESIRADIRNRVAHVRRKWYTYQDAVWIEMVNNEESPPSSFYTGLSRVFIHRSCKEGEEPQVAGYVSQLSNSPDSKIEILCGSGYEWHKCLNGEIPYGSVPISTKHSDPIFIARGSYMHNLYIGPAYMDGTMRILSTEIDDSSISNISFDDNVQYEKLTDFEILVAKNVKHPYNGYGVPTDAIFIGYDEKNRETYLGRAWFSNDLLPAKVILHRRGAFVPYGTHEERVNEFEFVRMDPGTYKWEEGMNGEVPVNAVIGGCTNRGETLYFGRTMHHGNYIPGKVHPSHGVLYVPFGGQEINFHSYEVLVHVSGEVATA